MPENPDIWHVAKVVEIEPRAKETVRLSLETAEPLEFLARPGLQIIVACDEVDVGSGIRRGRGADLLGTVELDRKATVYTCGPPPMV